MNRRLSWMHGWPRARASAFAAGIVGIGYGVAWAAGVFPGFPIVGQGSYCQSTVGSSGQATGVPGGGGGGTTGQGAPAGSPCAQTVPAGPSALTGNELILGDTGLANGVAPQSVSMPSGMLTQAYQINALVGSDFGTALWQRTTAGVPNTPLSAVTPASAAYGPDGWYAIEIPATAGGALSTMTVSKQTGASDLPPNSLASARVQRVNAQTALAQICVGQLVPQTDSQVFPGKTAIFAADMLAGALFSPSGNFVNMIIAVHSAADVTSEAANAQGTNTATFASSVPGTQNITNYTELVNTQIPITTTWTRYSVAAAVPTNIPGTSTAVQGIGVKLCFTPTGTAGATDWFEFGKAQLEARIGTSIGPSTYQRPSLQTEWNRELSRYFQISENGSSGTPIYANGYLPNTGASQFSFQFPTTMRLTPVVSPITVGGFEFAHAGTLSAPSSITSTGLTQTQHTGNINANYSTGGLTAGQGSLFVGSGAGTGVLGFSAEP